MTTAVDRLQALGFTLIPEPPDTIRVRWPAGPEPAEGRALIDELREHKAAVLAALTTPQRWDDAAERERLNASMDRCDDSARTVDSWADCWDWATHRRPDLVEAVDDALDAIDAAHKAKDTRASIEACRLLQSAVQAAADAFQALPEVLKTVTR
ncbi:hypothetical protein BH18GEM1_BH18GEM1_22480 [soil metagenome]